MKSRRFLPSALSVVMLLVAVTTAAAKSENITEGRLDAFDAKGKSLGACPLKHTDVTVDVAGFIARVTVKQQFQAWFKSGCFWVTGADADRCPVGIAGGAAAVTWSVSGKACVAE